MGVCPLLIKFGAAKQFEYSTGFDLICCDESIAIEDCAVPANECGLSKVIKLSQVFLGLQGNANKCKLAVPVSLIEDSRM